MKQYNTAAAGLRPALLKKIPCIVSFSVLIAALSTGCYQSSGTTDDSPIPDATDSMPPDVRYDVIDLSPPDIPQDHGMDNPCRTISPAVLWVDIDLEGCFHEEPFVTVIIQEVSPYCGYSFSWSHDVEWIDDDTVEITPSLYMCSDTWEWCDPGAANTAYVTIDLPWTGGVFDVIVDGETYGFACLDPECGWQLAYLEDVHPSDGRLHRLYDMSEDINFEVIYTTGLCGCSYFEPLLLTQPDYAGDNHYFGSLVAEVCYDECCWDCACIDVGWSEQSIENLGIEHSYEIVLDGVFKYVRGFIVDPIAEPPDPVDPFSGCEIFPARITAASSDRTYYDMSEPIDLDVTIEYESYPFPMCCEEHTDVAYDVMGDDGVYLFAYRGDCPFCNDDSCPPEDFKTLRISPYVLNLGEHIVYDRNTGESLYSFYVVGED